MRRWTDLNLLFCIVQDVVAFCKDVYFWCFYTRGGGVWNYRYHSAGWDLGWSVYSWVILYRCIVWIPP